MKSFENKDWLIEISNENLKLDGNLKNYQIFLIKSNYKFILRGIQVYIKEMHLLWLNYSRQIKIAYKSEVLSNTLETFKTKWTKKTYISLQPNKQRKKTEYQSYRGCIVHVLIQW